MFYYCVVFLGGMTVRSDSGVIIFHLMPTFHRMPAASVEVSVLPVLRVTRSIQTIWYTCNFNFVKIKSSEK